MNPKTLRKIKRELQEMRRSPQGRKASEFIALAMRLGRKRDKRGSEPNYVRADDPTLSPPLSIPGHAGDLKTGTARNIIDALLNDVDEWMIYFQETQDEHDDDDDNED